MTYCVAIKVNSGIVFCSDSRTNAGVDQISTYSKMYSFGTPGERQLTILASGNLATTQAVLARVRKDIDKNTTGNLLKFASLRDAAEYLGTINREIIAQHAGDELNYEATFILGGQISNGKKHGIFLIYPQGNNISTSKDTLFLQIGESKYGKPILDRVLTTDTNLITAASAALISMDSTIRSNLSVGPPIEISIYTANTFEVGNHFKFEEDSEYLRRVKKEWDNRLREAFIEMPPIVWGEMWDQSPDERNSAS